MKATLRALLILICWTMAGCLGRSSPNSTGDPTLEMARSVTIHRDAYGVPHVFGPSDASVVFGAAFARAEDEFHYMEQALVKLLGRAAEVSGGDWLPWDHFVRRLEIERHSRQEYAEASAEVRALCDAFASGLNYYLRLHPEVQPRLFRRFEPWHALVGYRLFHVSGLGEETLSQLGQKGMLESFTGYLASTMWAVNSSRSKSGHPMLFINPHIPLDAPYEFSLHSEEGLNISGHVAYGIGILPIAGHNGQIAWSITANEPDINDVYRETFVDEDHYRFGEELRTASRWTEQFVVGSPAEELSLRETTSETVEFLRTHNGPVFTVGEDRLALRMAKIQSGGVLAQFYDMARATNLKQFQAAIAPMALTYNNVLYAGRDDHLFYVYGGAIPKRNPEHDWSLPVDGSDPSTDWGGFFELTELPQVLDPASGFIQNSNSSPFTVTTDALPNRDDYPAYMFRHDRDTNIARQARELLSGEEWLSFERFAALAFDTHMPMAQRDLATLADEIPDFRQQYPQQTEELTEALRALSGWDHRARADSSVSLLYLAFFHQDSDDDPFPSVRRLQTAIRALEDAYGTWKVPLGDVVRLERAPSRIAGNEPTSLPTKGLPFYTGAIFTFNTQPGTGGQQVGRHGHSYVGVVELGDSPHALSVMPYGQSRDPLSPHYFDQAPLYSEGRFKRAWFTREEILQAAVRSYRPGGSR